MSITIIDIVPKTLLMLNSLVRHHIYKEFVVVRTVSHHILEISDVIVSFNINLFKESILNVL